MVQLDARGTADPIDFGTECRPDAIMQVLFNPNDDPHCCVKVSSRLHPEGSAHVVPVDNLSSFIVRAGANSSLQAEVFHSSQGMLAAESFGFFIVPPRGWDPMEGAPRLPSPTRPPSRPLSAHMDLLPQKLFGSSIQRTRSNISKASSATASYFSGGRAGGTSTAPTSVSDMSGIKSPPAEVSIAKQRSPNGAVWYRQRSQSMRSPDPGPEAQETLQDHAVAGIKHSSSDPSVYTDDASTSQPADEDIEHDRRRMLSASPEPTAYYENPRTPSRAASTRSTRRPLGPRQLGASAPPSRSVSDNSVHHEDVDRPVPSPPEEFLPPRGLRESPSSLSKRPREVDESPELSRSFKKSARGDVSPGDASIRPGSPVFTRKRLSSSVGTKERRPRRRRPTVDKASLTPDQLPDIIMNEVGGAEENVSFSNPESRRELMELRRLTTWTLTSSKPRLRCA